MRALRLPIPNSGGPVKPGVIILAGACIASGAIAYHGTMAGASGRPIESPSTPAATEPELAHSAAQKTTPEPHGVDDPHPTPDAHATPSVVAATTPAVRLTLDQVRQLPRPPVAPSSAYIPPASSYPSARTTPAPSPAGEPGEPPPAEDPPPTPVPSTPTASPSPAPPTPTPSPVPNPWNIPTPPPFPPHPDGWIQPLPPSEQ